MITLPDLPSELLELALHDLGEIEKDPKYTIDMHDWHHKRGGVCHVCLAGAVMATRLEVEPRQWLSPYDFEDPIANKLAALNELRLGEVMDALDTLRIDLPKGLEQCVEVIDYHDDAGAFKEDMRDLIALLKEHGL